MCFHQNYNTFTETKAKYFAKKKGFDEFDEQRYL